MTLSALLVQVLSFYILYNTSKRADVRKDGFSIWFQNHPGPAIIIGLISMIISFTLLIFSEGFGVGIFMGFLWLMTIGSLIVILAPLRTKRPGNAG